MKLIAARREVFHIALPSFVSVVGAVPIATNLFDGLVQTFGSVFFPTYKTLHWDQFRELWGWAVCQ